MASTPKDLAQGRFWRIYQKIKALLRLFFKETSISTSEKDEIFYYNNRWADLPTDLLENILFRIPPRDVIRACSVCTAWSSILSASPTRLLRLPWLLQPTIGKIDSFPFITFWCPNKNPIIFDVHLPSDIYRIRHSGILGWLHVSDHSGEYVHLLNPLNRVRVSLPNFRNSYDFSTSIFAMSETNIKTNFFPRPLKILCACNFKLLLHIKPADGTNYSREWITLLVFKPYYINNIIFHQDKVFALLDNGVLMVCDLNGPYPVIRIFMSDFWNEVTRNYGGFNATSSRSYLVQRSGHIYQLLLNADDKQQILAAFKLKLDPNEFFSSSSHNNSDNIFPAEKNFYLDFGKNLEILHDDSILRAHDITFLDGRNAMFIPRVHFCGSYNYATTKCQFYHVDSFKVSRNITNSSFWFLWDNPYNDLSWFIPATFY